MNTVTPPPNGVASPTCMAAAPRPMRTGLISDTPVRTESEQQQFFAAAMERTLQAEAVAGVADHDITIAGTVVRLRFAGVGLAELFLPALSHLLAPALPPPDAVFHIWDSRTTGVEMIPPPCSRDCFTDRGDIWGYSSERIRTAFHWSEFSVNLMDTIAGEAIYWVAEADSLPYWSRSSPFRTLFHWFLEPRGCQLLHAACVGTDRGAALITGKGGVGKSTTALTCLAHGMRYVGDDYLVVRLDPQPRAYSLYATAKLHHDNSKRFPAHAELIINADRGDDEKAVLQLYPERRSLLAASLPLRVVLTPKFGSQASTGFEPVSAAALRHAAAFTTMTQLPHAGRSTYDRIDRLLRQVPGLQMRLGEDLNRIPDAIAGLLARDDAEIAALARADAASATQTTPLVSVIIPVRNGADFVAQAIDSILGQGYPNLEIIAVDDGSTDDIEGAIRALPVDIRLFRSFGAGPAEARNVGIRNASADLLAFIDVDDLWPANRLSVMVDRLMETPAIDVVLGYSQLLRRDPASGEYHYVGNPAESFPYYIGSGLYRRTAFETADLFDRRLRFGEDGDWFFRAKDLGLQIERLDQVTLLVRRHDRNMTRGRTAAELNPLLVFKNKIERRRAAQTHAP